MVFINLDSVILCMTRLFSWIKVKKRIERDNTVYGTNPKLTPHQFNRMSNLSIFSNTRVIRDRSFLRSLLLSIYESLVHLRREGRQNWA